MGFGQGGVQRVKSVKINRAQLKNRKRKGYFKSPPDNQVVKSDFVDHNKMNSEEFAAFKTQVKKQEKGNQKRLYLTFGIIVVLFGTAVYCFLYS